MDTMISLDDILISEDILRAEFVCDLSKCKGACCIEGDAGAPLKRKELKELEKVFHLIRDKLTPEALAVIQKKGLYDQDEDYTYVTPIIGDGICVYGTLDENGTVICQIEQAYLEGKTDFKKPISCHLYPIIHTKTKNFESLNYYPREVLCKPACKLGKKLKIPVYEFLKEPICREFGEDFYETLAELARDFNESSPT